MLRVSFDLVVRACQLDVIRVSFDLVIRAYQLDVIRHFGSSYCYNNIYLSACLFVFLIILKFF